LQYDDGVLNKESLIAAAEEKAGNSIEKLESSMETVDQCGNKGF
jgi:hypothetical protein